MVINNTLKRNPSLCGAKPTLIAFCVTTLCMIGLHKAFAGTKTMEFNFILLPYVALAVAILFVLLLKGLFNLSRKDRGKSYGYSGDNNPTDNNRTRR